MKKSVKEIAKVKTTEELQKIFESLDTGCNNKHTLSVLSLFSN